MKRGFHIKRWNGSGEELASFSFCAVFTRGAGDGAQKNSLETQRERIQIDLMYAKSGAIQRHFCIMTINNARSVGAGIDMEFWVHADFLLNKKTDYIPPLRFKEALMCEISGVISDSVETLNTLGTPWPMATSMLRQPMQLHHSSNSSLISHKHNRPTATLLHSSDLPKYNMASTENKKTQN